MVGSGERVQRGRAARAGSGSGVCQEQGAADFAQATWRKSSFSAYNGNCVEVAGLGGRRIGVRDTKDAGKGPVLVFGDAAWRSFIESVKNGS